MRVMNIAINKRHTVRVMSSIKCLLTGEILKNYDCCEVAGLSFGIGSHSIAVPRIIVGFRPFGKGEAGRVMRKAE